MRTNEANQFVVIKIQRNRANGIMKIIQSNYVDTIYDNYEMDNGS